VRDFEDELFARYHGSSVTNPGLQVTDALIQALQGLASRKNCCAPEMRFVTVFCPLTTTGDRETLAQTSGATRFVVDCKVNTPLVAGHLTIVNIGAAAPDPAGMTVTARIGELVATGLGPDTNAGENATVLSPALPWLKSIPPT